MKFIMNRASIKCCITRHIVRSQLKCLQELGNGNIFKAYREMEMLIQRSLLRMELIGMAVDGNCLDTLSEQISDHIGRLEKEIFRLNGKRFAVNSSKTVAQVLRICKKNGTQAKRCTRADLEKCGNPIAKLILEHRSLIAILSNSIQPLIKKVENNRYGMIILTFFCDYFNKFVDILEFTVTVSVLQPPGESQCMNRIYKMSLKIFMRISKVRTHLIG